MLIVVSRELKKMKKIFLPCLSGLLAIAVGGSLGAQERREPSNRGELRLQKEVRHELVTLPLYDVFDNLAFKVEGGTVTLLGQVTRPTIKSDAEKAVRGIEGVERVDNRIEVLPLSPNDDQLRRAVYRAIYGSEGLDRYAMRAVPTIHIIVKNGHVFLEGAVATEADKNLANLRANGVSGVFSVTNNLQVDRT
jgi:hyperosmotically inducible protein